MVEIQGPAVYPRLAELHIRQCALSRFSRYTLIVQNRDHLRLPCPEAIADRRFPQFRNLVHAYRRQRAGSTTKAPSSSAVQMRTPKPRIWPSGETGAACDIQSIRTSARSRLCRTGPSSSPRHDSRFCPGGRRHDSRRGRVTIGHPGAAARLRLIALPDDDQHGAIVMDGCQDRLARHPMLGCGCVVPPGKQLAGGFLYVGGLARQRQRRALSSERGIQFHSAIRPRKLLREALRPGAPGNAAAGDVCAPAEKPAARHWADRSPFPVRTHAASAPGCCAALCRRARPAGCQPRNTPVRATASANSARRC